ncbi:DUF4920 domain-containing protein [Muricauda sp. CAU 1633]|uniref:DUF4920 domain-containing protein n=1 Tax=Allomuricauda sp. CAU 1633 TaxID=2816036 RepID=UPI001A90A461|nr:DUF4920 domain-containing protein [Muricauda sp. CAU 1633]MBO0321954.1 DUF4920 domain-containing protein [Muricauda sp. CAU 1633]
MRPFNIYPVVFLLFLMNMAMAQETVSGNYYGEAFKIQESIKERATIYNHLAVTDTLMTQMTGTIKEVCQVKGCWMNITLDSGDEVFVRFKDYGFFVPTDATEKTVFMNGLAFLEEMSVEDQKHYAKDSGASEEEIAQIKEPAHILRFEADGVLIKD